MFYKVEIINNLAVLINTRIFRLFVTFCSGGQNLWRHLWTSPPELCFFFLNPDTTNHFLVKDFCALSHTLKFFHLPLPFFIVIWCQFFCYKKGCHIQGTFFIKVKIFLFFKINFIFEKILLNVVHTQEISQSFLITFFIKVIFWFRNVWSFFYRPFLNFVLIKRSILLARSGSLILSVGLPLFSKASPRLTTYFVSHLYKSFTITY